MREMKVGWLQFGNTEVARKRFGVPPLPYPLAFNLPPMCWNEKIDSLLFPRNGGAWEAHLDLVVELDRVISSTSSSPIGSSAVRGYRFLIGIFDPTFRSRLIHPSVRDQGVTDYYGRWNDASNGLSPLFRLTDTEVLKLKGFWSVAGQRQDFQIQFDLGALEIFQFFQGFNHLEPGDWVSLGTQSIMPVTSSETLEISLKTPVLSDSWHFQRPRSSS